MVDMNIRRRMPRPAAWWPLALLCGALSGCSTSFWYTQIQAHQYDKCEAVRDSAERQRCKQAARPDEEAYRQQRERARGKD